MIRGRKGRETDLEHSAHGKQRFGLRGHLKRPAQHQRLSMRRRSDLAALWCTGGSWHIATLRGNAARFGRFRSEADID